MKKYTLPIVLILGIILVSLFVTAKMTVTQDDGLRYRYKTEVQLEKGWNLIAGFEDNSISQDSEITIDDLKVVYFYNPLSKNYVSIFPRSAEYDNLIFNTLTCGDSVCDVKERQNYSNWCSKDCWNELSLDILNNIKVKDKKEFMVGLNENKILVFDGYESEFYLEDGQDFNGVKLKDKVSDRPIFDSAADIYKTQDNNGYNWGRLISDSWDSNKEMNYKIFVLVGEPVEGKYKVTWYQIESNAFSTPSHIENVPSMQDKITSQSAWVYSKKKGVIRFEYTVLKLKNIELNSGWNFMTMTPEMISKNISELQGTCNIEKAYGFEPDRKTWNDLLDERLPEEATGVGFILKVTNNCKLENAGSSDDIPQLPGTDKCVEGWSCGMKEIEYSMHRTSDCKYDIQEPCPNGCNGSIGKCK